MCICEVTEPIDLRGFDANAMLPTEALGGHKTFCNRAASRVGKMHGDASAVAIADPYGGSLAPSWDASAFMQSIGVQRAADYHLDVRSKLKASVSVCPPPVA